MFKSYTAKQVDDACRRGDFVFIGNRQRIIGATTNHHTAGEAAPGHVWVSRGTEGWIQVKLSEISIDQRNGGSMPAGKRASGRPGPPSKAASKKEDTGTPAPPSKRKAVQPGLPGVEQEKLPAIERAAKKYDDLKEPFATARDALASAKDSLLKMMHDKIKPNEAGELVYKRGKVKVTIKPSKEKLKVVIGDDEDDEEVEVNVGAGKEDEDEEE